MTRRSAIGALLGLDSERACSVLLDVRTGRIVNVQRADLAAQWVIPPGSTLKPLSLTALLQSGKMRADERFVCPRRLEIGGRSYDCSHPRLGAPLDIAAAIAYSCNCFVAHFAQRFEPGELARFLRREKIGSESGIVSRADDMTSRELQAIGESHVAVSPLGLASAYSRLAARAPDPVLDGLEGAVEFGTAQLARLSNVRVAGKTGTVLLSTGTRAAWFAGFAPSRKAEVAIVAVVQGRSGGLDAAPIARRVLEGRL